MTIIPGRYRYYKGMEYQVIGCARHSETEEAFVVYRGLIRRSWPVGQAVCDVHRVCAVGENRLTLFIVQEADDYER